MRAISAAAAAVLASGQVVMALLYEFQLVDGTARFTSAEVDIEHEGATYAGGISVITDAIADGGENRGISITVSGVSPDALALALADNVRGRPCLVRLAVLDPETHQILDAPVIYRGALDQMPISEGGGTASVGVTVESRLVTMGRPRPLRYTDVDQQRLYPGDASLRFVLSQSQVKDVWPAASFFRQ